MGLSVDWSATSKANASTQASKKNKQQSGLEKKKQSQPWTQAPTHVDSLDHHKEPPFKIPGSAPGTIGRSGRYNRCLFGSTRMCMAFKLYTWTMTLIRETTGGLNKMGGSLAWIHFIISKTWMASNEISFSQHSIVLLILAIQQTWKFVSFYSGT